MVKLYNHLAACQGNLCVHASQPTVGFSEEASIYCEPIMYHWHLGKKGEKKAGRNSNIVQNGASRVECGVQAWFHVTRHEQRQCGYCCGSQCCCPLPSVPCQPTLCGPMGLTAPLLYNILIVVTSSYRLGMESSPHQKAPDFFRCRCRPPSKVARRHRGQM